MDQCAHRCRAFHGVRQPDVERELSGLADGAAKKQQRNKSSAGAERNKTGVFKAAVVSIVKDQCAGSSVEPQNAEKESDVANASSDECFFCSGRCARPLNPESNE